MAELTPMMRQFFDLKKKHPDAILLFRCGDFYETYADDAVVAAEILGITLTRRNNGNSNENTAMAGFPHHALDTYLPKLVRAGKRVAICDQLEDPKLAKKLVRRGITELVTPGVAMTDGVLQAGENNFVCAVHVAADDMVGISLLDISTGEWLVAEGAVAEMRSLIACFAPKEILYQRGRRSLLDSLCARSTSTFALDDWVFNPQDARERLLKHFGTRSLKGFGIAHMHAAVVAAGVVLYYLQDTGHNQLKHITSIRRIENDRYVWMDRFTIRGLELTESTGEGGLSLRQVIDRTTTPMGARLLPRWILFPLCDTEKIRARQDVVEYFFRHPDFRDMLHHALSACGDMERIVGKMAGGRATPRDVVGLLGALAAIVSIKEAAMTADDPHLAHMGQELNLCAEARERIAHDLVSEPPANLQKGGAIAQGVDPELDRLRQIATGGKDYLLQLQQREAENTGIQSLKIGYNNVFGYYLEVRNTYKDLVPPQWIRKQTLVGAERYITQELKQYEQEILGAEERILVLEAELYGQLLTFLADFTGHLQRDAALLARLDCLLSFALVAAEQGYIRPTVDDTTHIDICQGRHPVIEAQMPQGERYIANDVHLDTEAEQILIITGPNMAGKSALLRQTALITIMAQMGSFVPAESATIGVVDKVFSRVGASDNISRGESTFMVEMNEAASILNNISRRSLVLFDELGRGTSTYDGISIAWAIVEYIHENTVGHARTLFATHFHELGQMASLFPRIRNYNVSVREIRGRIIFLRRLEPGASEHSFGIHVARLAGMPTTIVNRAEVILRELEQNSQNSQNHQNPTPPNANCQSQGMQLSFFQLDDPVLSQIRDEILELDINNLTPIQALNKLAAIKKIVKGR